VHTPHLLRVIFLWLCTLKRKCVPTLPVAKTCLYLVPTVAPHYQLLQNTHHAVQFNSTYLVPMAALHYQFLQNTHYDDIVQYSPTVHTWCQLLLHITSCYRTHITMILYSTVQQYIPGSNCCSTLPVPKKHKLQ